MVFSIIHMQLFLVTRLYLLYSTVVTIFQWSFVTNFDVVFHVFELFHTLSDVFIMEYINCGIKNHTRYELVPYPY